MSFKTKIIILLTTKNSKKFLPMFSNMVPSTITAGGGVWVGSGTSDTTIAPVGCETTLPSLDSGSTTVSRNGPSSFSGSTEFYMQLRERIRNLAAL